MKTQNSLFQKSAKVETEIYDSEKKNIYDIAYYLISHKKCIFQIVLKYFQKQKQKVIVQATGTLASNT